VRPKATIALNLMHGLHSKAYLSSNSTCSICCKFVVQQIYNDPQQTETSGGVCALSYSVC